MTTTYSTPRQTPTQRVLTVPTALGPGDPDDGEQGRRLRGMAIAALEQDRIRPDRFGHKVPSQSGNGAYLVNLEHGPYCTCEDFEKRRKACKHVYAVQAILQGDEPLEAPPKAVRLGPGWAPYNAAQVREGELFATLLRELCDTVPQPPQANGRPRLPIGDMLYAMGLKVYSTLSTRRAMSSIREAVSAGRMEREPSYSTPIQYFKRADVTPVLRELIQRSALPLADVEVDFAQDSSGFASTAYNRWFDHKWGGNKKEVKWVKLHLMCGVRSNIVTVADATASQSADSPYLADFVQVTAQNFHINEVSADMAYSSKKNLHAIVDAGGTPYIPFKARAVARPQRQSRADSLWEQMYRFFTLNELEFNRHYHKRSNVETVFHMIKAKFGDKVRAKTDTARVNEALMKVLCHNICVLIRAMHELGVTPVFDGAPDGV